MPESGQDSPELDIRRPSELGEDMNANTESKTAPKVSDGRINGRFAPGYSGNPGGSPEATRRAFNKRFLLDLAEDWQQHGREVFKRVRRESPAAYLKVCAMLVPKEVKLERSTSAIKAMTDEEIEQAIEAIQTMLAAQAEKTKIIEATVEPTALPGPAEVRQLQLKRSNRLLEHVDAAIDPRDGGEANLSSLSKNS
jgi:hypothetical protein